MDNITNSNNLLVHQDDRLMDLMGNKLPLIEKKKVDYFFLILKSMMKGIRLRILLNMKSQSVQK